MKPPAPVTSALGIDLCWQSPVQRSGMRILVVGNAASPHVRRWVRALHDGGHEVCCSGFGDLDDDRLPMRTLGSSDLSHRRYLFALPALHRTVRAFRPDV